MLYKRIEENIPKAMKSRDVRLLNVLKLIKSELVRSEKNGILMNDENVVKILSKMVSQREDSIKQYNLAKREDLAKDEEYEVSIIKSFMPEEPSDDEVNEWTNKCIDAYIASKGNTYTLSMKDMKPIMSMVKEKYTVVNGKTISQIIKDRI